MGVSSRCKRQRNYELHIFQVILYLLGTMSEGTQLP